MHAPPFGPSWRWATAGWVEAMANGIEGDSRYIVLTTYRRDGRPVTTPVWGVALDEKIYVFTASTIGKAKRVRATERVRCAPCTMNGRRILGEWREGTAHVEGDRRAGDADLLPDLRKRQG